MAKAKGKVLMECIKELQENQGNINCIEDPDAQKAVQTIQNVFLKALRQS